MYPIPISCLPFVFKINPYSMCQKNLPWTGPVQGHNGARTVSKIASPRFPRAHPIHLQWSEDFQSVMSVLPENRCLLITIAGGPAICNVCLFLAVAPLLDQSTYGHLRLATILSLAKAWRCKGSAMSFRASLYEKRRKTQQSDCLPHVQDEKQSS